MEETRNETARRAWWLFARVAAASLAAASIWATGLPAPDLPAELHLPGL